MTWPPQATRAEVLRLLEQNRQFATWVISREETAVLIALLRDTDQAEEITRLREIAAGAHAIRCTCEPRVQDSRCHELQTLGPGGETHHDLTRPIWTPEEEE